VRILFVCYEGNSVDVVANITQSSRREYFFSFSHLEDESILQTPSLPDSHKTSTPPVTCGPDQRPGPTCRSRVSGKPQVRSGLRSGVPEKTQVRSGLRSGRPRDLDLRPGPDRSIFGPASFFFKCGEMEEDQERDSPSDEEREIIQDEDMEDSATDIIELWIPDRNDEDTKFVRGQGHTIPTKK
jgi:hypothetical protein